MTILDDKSLPGFTVQVLNQQFIEEKPDRREEIIKIISNSFAQKIPISVHLGITAEKLAKYFFPHVIDKAIKDELSLICTSNDNNRIVAFMLNEDFHDTMNADEAEIQAMAEVFPEIIPVFMLFGSLDEKLVEKYFSENTRNGPLRPNQVLHAFTGTTDEEYEGRGIGTRLRALTGEYAKAKQFTHVCVEPVSQTSEHIWIKKLGGTIGHEIVLADFELPDGSKPLSAHFSDGSKFVIVLLAL